MTGTANRGPTFANAPDRRWCHLCPNETSMHPRADVRLYGSPEWGGLWHCPDHARQPLTDKTWRDLIRGGEWRLLACGCPYDPSYSDPLPCLDHDPNSGPGSDTCMSCGKDK